MTCIEFQKLITPYIDNNLEINKLEEFIYHLNHCPDCKEELEVYYTLLTGMKQLDEDKNLSGDFHIDFVNCIRKSEENIIRNRIKRARKKLILIVGVIFVTIIFTFSRSIIDEVKGEKGKSRNYPTLQAANEFTKFDFYKRAEGSLTENIIYKDFNKIIKYIRYNSIKGEQNGKKISID